MSEELESELPGHLHLRCLLMPVVTVVFVALQPESPWIALGFAAFPFALDFLETRTADETRQPPARESGLVFDLMLYGLFLCHAVTLPLSASLIEAHGWLSIQTAAMFSLVVVSSCLCGAIGAHELIHRRHPLEIAMGRLLLASLFYEHLYTEHLRGHHRRVGTPEDVSTARFGESFRAFLVRNVPGQLASAWRLEDARLHRVGGPLARFARNRVVHGWIIEAGIAGVFFAGFGASGLAFLVVQALAVQFVWMAVHYFEHWGLVRLGRIDYGYSWDTDNRASLLSMVGLARHADHHAHPGRHFEALEHVAASPKLPRGYGGMIFLSIFENAKFQRLMTAELARRGTLPGDLESAPAEEPLEVGELA